MKFFFYKHLGHKLARFAMAVFHRVNQRQRDFPFFQVAQHRLAQLLRRSREIQQIVYQLKRQPGVPAILRQRLLFLAFQPAEHGPKPRAAAEQASRFVGGQAQCVFFRHVNAPDFFQLDQFAFHHFLGHVDEDIENAKVAFLQRHLEGLHVQPVSGEHAAVVAPTGIGRGTSSARPGAVDHVIVNQRSAVQQLDHCCKANRAAIFAPRIIRGKQQQSGAQALPSAAEQIRGNFRHRRVRRVALARQLVFHQSEVVADEIENLFRREKCDGLPPGPCLR